MGVFNKATPASSAFPLVLINKFLISKCEILDKFNYLFQCPEAVESELGKHYHFRDPLN
jgi:hypothetical protein